MKIVSKKEWQDFVNLLTALSEQAKRMLERARGAGLKTTPDAEYKEMLLRFEKAAANFLGERRPFWESREAFFNRIATLKPDQMLAMMRRNGVQLRV